MPYLDPKTGGSSVVSPAFDPNDLAGHDLEAVGTNYDELNAAERSPSSTGPSAVTYPPGSVFKVVTAAAALSTGEYDEDTMLPGPAVLDLPGPAPTCPTPSTGRAARTTR